MKMPSNARRAAAGPVLTLIAFMAGLVAPPAHCQDQAVSPVSATTLVTNRRWVPTGNLNVARSGHTATLLANGKALVVGGYGDANGLDSAELYDLSAGTWSVTGRLNYGRTDHSATLLPNGKVLVAGGYFWDAGDNRGRASDTAELYDPGTGTWSLTGKLRDGHAFHSATLLRTGKVLVAGGNGPAFVTALCELYDPATGTWSLTGSLGGFGRDLPQATLLQDGRVLVTGGTYDIESSFGLPTAELYDPVAGTWSPTRDLLVPRVNHAATLLPDGKVLVAGGDSHYPYDPYQGGPVQDPPNNTAEVFDPVTGSWSSTKNLNTGRSGHTASLLPNGDVLVAGGYTHNPPGPGGYIKSAERYDASSALWRNTTDLGTTRYGHTATLLPNGRVLVAGGYGAGRNLDSAELYDATVSPDTIGPGFTGMWFDPALSGQGLFVEVLDDNRFLAWWFTFNPAGTQRAWFGGVGIYSGNTATIADVYQTTGGRWIPNFDPSRIVNNAWGTLTFTFTDCNHGKVDFNSVTGYGTGSMNLTRLTLPTGLACQ